MSITGVVWWRLQTRPHRSTDTDARRTSSTSERVSVHEIRQARAWLQGSDTSRCTLGERGRGGGRGDHTRPKRLICTGVCDLLGVPTEHCASAVGEPCPPAVTNGVAGGCGQGEWEGQRRERGRANTAVSNDPASRSLLAKFILADEPWKADAACLGKAPNRKLDPEARDPWFPEKGQPLDEGQLICISCTVRAECKDYKQRTRSKEGMWAGEIEKRK